MNRRESAIRIWFSVTQSTTVIRGATPILRIASRDLDGDKRDELIVSSPSAGLQVWTQHRKGFGKLRPKRSKHPTLAHPTRHTIEDGPVEDVVVIDPTGPPPVAISLIPHSRAPAPRSVRAITGPNSVRVLAPLGPRPPPLSI
jgi:hypothetical protein